MIGAISSGNGFYSGLYSNDAEFKRCSGSSYKISLDPGNAFLSESAEITWYKNGNVLNLKERSMIDSVDADFRVSISSNGCIINSGLIKITTTSKFPVSIHGNPVTSEISICEQFGKRNLFPSFSYILADTIFFSWYRNNERSAHIQGNYQYSAVEPGVYKLEVKQGNCSVFSEEIQVNAGLKPSYEFGIDGFPNDKRTLRICKDSKVNYRFRANVPGGGYLIRDQKGVIYESYKSYNLEPGEYYFTGSNGSCSIYDTLKVITADTFDLELMSNSPRIQSCYGIETRYFFPLDVGFGYNSLWGTNPEFDQQYFYSTRNGQQYTSGTTDFFSFLSGYYQLHYREPGWCPGVSEKVVFPAVKTFQAFNFEGDSKVTICKGDVYNLTLKSYPNKEISWLRDGEEIAKSSNIQRTVAEPGTYWVQYKDDGGCTYYSDSVTVETIEMPQVWLSEVCNSDSSGSIFKVNLSFEAANLKYRWYGTDTYIPKSEDGPTLNVNSGYATYYAVVDNGVCIRKTNSLSKGLYFPDRAWECVGQQMVIKPIGDSSNLSSLKWVFADGTEILSKDSLVIDRNPKYNGPAVVYSTSPGGCTIGSSIDFRLKDDVIFEIPDRIEFEKGEAIVIPVRYPRLTDSTETPQELVLINSNQEQVYGTQINLSQSNRIIIQAGKFDDSSKGIYTIKGLSTYGCGTSKSVELAEVDQSSREPILILQDFNIYHYCYGQDLKLSYFVSGKLDSKVELFATLYKSNMQDSIVGKPENGYFNFGILPVHFMDDAFFIVFKTSDPSVLPFKSNRYTLQWQELNRQGGINYESLCDAVKIEADITDEGNISWFLNDKVIEGASGTSITVFEEGIYRYIIYKPSNNNYGCKTVLSPEINIRGTLGQMKKPSIKLDENSFCNRGIDRLILDNAEQATSILWFRNDTIVSNETEAYLNTELDGIYKAKIHRGFCEEESEPFFFHKNKYRKVFLGPSGFDRNSQTDHLPDNETVMFCRGSSFKLVFDNNLNPNYSEYKNIGWWRDGFRINNIQDRENTFDVSGTYRITGQYGFCELLSNKVKMVERDTIPTKLIVARFPGDDMLANLNFYTIDETFYDNFKTIQDHQWYFNGDFFLDKDEFVHNAHENYFDVHINVSSPGIYNATGSILTADGKTCVIASDQVEIKADTNIIYAQNYATTINICGNKPYLLEPGFYWDRFLDYKWSRNGELIEHNEIELFVTKSGFYSLVAKSKEGLEYKWIFNIHFNSKPLLSLINEKYEELQSPFEKPGMCSPYSSVLLNADFYGFETAEITSWYRNDTLFSRLSNNLLPVSSEGLYKFKMKSGDCEVFSNELSVNFKKSTPVNKMNSNAFICNGVSTNLNEFTNDLDNIVWSTDISLLALEPSNSFYVQEVGVYKAYQEIKGCLKPLGQVNLSQLQLPDTLFALGDLEFCPGQILTIAGVPLPGVEYFFVKDGQEVEGNGNELKISESGKYQLFYQRGNCNVGSNILEATTAFETQLAVTDNLLCEGEVTTISSFSEDEISYEWYRNGQLIPENTNPLIEVASPGVYYAKLGLKDCEANTDSIEIKMHDLSYAEISGNSEIAYGDTTSILVKISGSAFPWRVTISDGLQFTTEHTENIIEVSPKQSVGYQITDIKDRCGRGEFEGLANVTVVVLGLEEEINEWQIYPNPAIQYIFLNTFGNPVRTIYLSDLTGKNIPVTPIATEHGYLIALDSVEQGFYVLKVEHEGKMRSFKIVIR